METDLGRGAEWSKLSWDLTDLILSKLPLRSIVGAAAVCRFWRAVVTDPSFPSRAAIARRPWFFLYGHNNVSPRLNQAFAFDPNDDDHPWFPLPLPATPSDSFSGSGGFLLASASCSRLLFSPLPFLHPCLETPSLSFPRCNPVITTFGPPGSIPRLLVVGGARLIGGLVDIEEPLAAEIYDPSICPSTWQICPSLPPEFRSGISNQWLSSALVSGRHFFVHGIYSSLVSSFDLTLRSWSPVRVLRPPGILFSYLLPGPSDRLLLAGLAAPPGERLSVFIWAVDPWTMGYNRIGEMPREMFSCLFDLYDDEDDTALATLKCVGLDSLVYVFNEDHSKAYPAAVCEVVDGDTCTWRIVPPLPSPINRFHKVLAFCSPVPIAHLVPN